MVQVTVADFRTNFGKYLSLVSREDIHITQNGMDIAILVPPKTKASIIDELIGVIPDDGYGVKQARADRRKHHECDSRINAYCIKLCFRQSYNKLQPLAV